MAKIGGKESDISFDHQVLRFMAENEVDNEMTTSVVFDDFFGQSIEQYKKFVKTYENILPAKYLNLFESKYTSKRKKAKKSQNFSDLCKKKVI